MISDDDDISPSSGQSSRPFPSHWGSVTTATLSASSDSGLDRSQKHPARSTPPTWGPMTIDAGLAASGDSNLEERRSVRVSKREVPGGLEMPEMQRIPSLDANCNVYEEGDRVQSVHGFHSDSDPPVWIKVGRKGVIKTIDEDGDLMILFAPSKTCEWVGKSKGKKNLEVMTNQHGAIITQDGFRADPNRKKSFFETRTMSMHHAVSDVTVAKQSRAFARENCISIGHFFLLMFTAILIGYVFSWLFPAPTIDELDHFSYEDELTKDCMELLAPEYWVIFTALLAPLMTSIAFGPPRPGVIAPPVWKVALRNVIRLFLSANFCWNASKDITEILATLGESSRYERFSGDWFNQLHRCFLIFCSSSNLPAAMSATGIAELYMGHGAWVKVHSHFIDWGESEDAGADLLMKEQGIVFRVYEFVARITYVNFVYIFLLPYLIPASILYFYIVLPLVGSLILLTVILGMIIPAFCGLRGSRAQASLDMQGQIDAVSYGMQQAALKAIWKRTNHKMPESVEAVLCKYTEEASSMALTGAPKSSWIKYFYLPLVIGIVPVVQVLVAARLYSMGLEKYTYALSRTLTERNSGIFFQHLFGKLCAKVNDSGFITCST